MCRHQKIYFRIYLSTGWGAIFWRSYKQTIVATSTIEIELIACYETATHVLWMSNFFNGLKIVDLIKMLLKIFFDNTTTVFFFKNNKSSSRVSISTSSTSVLENALR